ncbi:hypothetical protein PRUPE_2G020000 [Prunus persica]|uniref:Uncharacterized protein n=1 Tax=Prunus persica TaxID=3760 RepID=A0A251Q9R0_PRUPE|nr:hypothetical protein PRUPE_2G020000 [Prunus persica]
MKIITKTNRENLMSLKIGECDDPRKNPHSTPLNLSEEEEVPPPSLPSLLCLVGLLRFFSLRIWNPYLADLKISRHLRSGDVFELQLLIYKVCRQSRIQ